MARHGDRRPPALPPLDDVIRAHLQSVLEACRGNRSNAARVLGVDRKTLARQLVRLGIGETPESRTLRPGSLVAIEGIDGAGLTTQAHRLVEYLKTRGHRALFTCEPSGGRVGTLIRELLLEPAALASTSAMRTYSLLFAADRIDHIHREVAPALAHGITVVSDRWYHSSLAYQRTGVDRDWIASMNQHTRTPDVTIVLDVPLDVAHQRRMLAGRPHEYFHAPETQRDVVAGYRATISELRIAGERIEVIDGTPNADLVFAAILRTLGIRR